jgi:uncharacterized protein YjiS (DUF1127 family)
MTQRRRINMLAGVVRFVRKQWQRWHERRALGILLRELNELDEHILKDIGFRRDEVVGALREGRVPLRMDWTFCPGSPAPRTEGPRHDHSGARGELLLARCVECCPGSTSQA